MSATPEKTASYRIVNDEHGSRYQFFCAISGALVCTSEPCSPDEAGLLRAWQSQGRAAFNLCHKCGRWVSDTMYNADVLQCVDCTPWEYKPRFCSLCGSPVPFSDRFCRRCGSKLQYKEVSPYDI